MENIAHIVDPRYSGERTITPILYHGTTAKFLADNTREGVYSTRGAESSTGTVYTDSRLSNPLHRAVINSDIFNSTPKLLVVNTSKTLEGISRELTERDDWIPFKYLAATSFIALDIELPQNHTPYVFNPQENQETARLNIDSIEEAIREILGLNRRVSVRETNPDEDIIPVSLEMADQ